MKRVLSIDELNVAPGASPFDFGNRTRHDLVVSRDLSLPAWIGADSDYLVLRKFCVRMAFALRSCGSSFHISVMNIIAVGSQPKVSRIATDRIIARMTDTEPRGDRANYILIYDSMRSIRSSRVLQFAIAIFVSCALPRPTIIASAFRNIYPRLARFRAEWLLCRSRLERLSTMATQPFSVINWHTDLKNHG